MITVVVGKEIEKIKDDFESYLNGMNMVGEISYSQYSELYDEGTKQIQKAYELGKAELEKDNEIFKKANEIIAQQRDDRDANISILENRIEDLETRIEKTKCLNEEIIKALKECPDYVWLHAHNGKAKHVYLQSIIDIVNEKFEEIKENDY